MRERDAVPSPEGIGIAHLKPDGALVVG